MHETLDETIDRVAGEMSAVAGDPALTARVRERMDGRRRVWLLPTLAAASVVGVVVLAMAALWPRVEHIPAPPPTSHELAANAAAPTVERGTSSAEEGGTSVPPLPNVEAGTPPLVEGGTSVPPPANLAGGSSALVEGGTSVPPQPALALVDADVEPVGPAPLAIAELAIAPLAMPEVAEIEPLRIENLQIAEIELENPKESR